MENPGCLSHEEAPIFHPGLGPSPKRFFSEAESQMSRLPPPSPQVGRGGAVGCNNAGLEAKIGFR